MYVWWVYEVTETQENYMIIWFCTKGNIYYVKIAFFHENSVALIEKESWLKPICADSDDQ